MSTKQERAANRRRFRTRAALKPLDLATTEQIAETVWRRERAQEAAKADRLEALEARVAALEANE